MSELEGDHLLCARRKFFFQVIYLLLYDLVVVLSLGYTTAHLGVAFARLGGIHTLPS